MTSIDPDHRLYAVTPDEIAALEAAKAVGEVWGQRLISAQYNPNQGRDSSETSQFELFFGWSRRLGYLNHIGQVLAKAGFTDYADFLKALKVHNVLRCLPPVTEAEVRDIAMRWTPTSESPARFTATDLSATEGETPEMIVPRIVYRGWPTIIYGRTGSGKSMLVAALALETTRAGILVGHWDEEMGENATALRYRSLGATEDELAALSYYAWPSPTLEDSRAFINQVMLDGSQLVVMDPTADLLAAAGLEENANSEVTQWFSQFPQRLTQEGIASIVVDGTPHDGGHARGASQKGYKAALMFALDVETEPRRDQVGVVTLTCTKDRFGEVGKDTVLAFDLGGDGNGGIVFRRRAETRPNPTDKADAESALLELWADNVVIALKVHAIGEASAITMTQLLAQLGPGARTDFKKQAISWAVADVMRPVLAKPGPRGSTLYWYEPSHANATASVEAAEDVLDAEDVE